MKKILTVSLLLCAITGEAQTVLPSKSDSVNSSSMKSGDTFTRKLSEVEIKLFPNPATHFISFIGFSAEKNIHYSIVNSSGETILENDTYNHSIDISELTGGQYILSLQSEDRQASKQFVKN